MIAAWVLGSAQAGEVTIGSYGRVQASVDATGGQGEPASVVTYDTRLQEAPYVELDLAFAQDTPDGPSFRVVVTPAVAGELFHATGSWSASLALRNLYAEVVATEQWSAWAGSRMYRGDDVYLLDFWPLDDLNTVGGGAAFRPDERWTLQAQVGASRLASGDYELQTQALPVAGGVGVEQVSFLDRERIVSSLKAGRTFGDDVVTRVSGYAELQVLPAGERLHDDQFVQELPSDAGSVLGAQVSLWGWADDSFVHLWLKRATGLAAYGDLSVPDGLAVDYRAQKAQEHLIALSANHELGPASVQAGAYVRRFTDADSNDIDVDDRWEANVAVRPTWYPAKVVSLGVELSQQWLRPDGLNPRTQAHDVPLITKFAVLPAIQPRPGSYARPQVRLQYVYSYLNNDARSWFAVDDPRHDSNHEQFVGIGAEWWLDSESHR
ncbi:MAG: carbohydrate porin [Myxococcota bacterium]